MSHDELLKDYQAKAKLANEQCQSKLNGRVKVTGLHTSYARKTYQVYVSGSVDYTNEELINFVDGGYSPFGGAVSKGVTDDSGTYWSVAVYTD